MGASSINFCHHDHTHGINEAMDIARQICISRGVRLTDSRFQVLELIWQNHKPLGAYTILEMLSKVSTRRVAPPTVYRALDFLKEQGFVHQIKSLNAFIGCPSPSTPHKHQSYFFICRKCGNAMELQQPNLTRQINSVAVKVGFTAETQSLEVIGICPECK